MIEKKEKFPLVSIIIPSYNHEKYIKETIESIVNQTYKNIELIVIDDGSKDNSVRIIQELSNKYGFIFLHRPNKGLSGTLNEGIKLSKGKYFAGCASDDIYALDKIEKQVSFMENNPDYGMCYGKVIKFDENTKTKIEIKNPKSGFVFDALLFGTFIPAVTQFIRKDVFNDIGLFDEKLYIEDWDMWLRIAKKYKIGYVNEYLAYYRQHETNISNKISEMFESEKQILEKYKDSIFFKEAINKKKFIYFLVLLKQNKKEALKFLPFAIKYFLTDSTILKYGVKSIFARDKIIKI